MSDNDNDTADNGSEEKGPESGRRSVLKSLTAGGVIAGAAIPDKWRTPVAESVVLPAHANTSTRQSTPQTCSAEIILAEVLSQNSALFVVAEANIPGACISSDTQSRGLLCELISDGVTLGRENRDTAGGDCTLSTAPVNGCLVSCSVSINSASHGVMDSDQITMRFTFGGVCVCSVVGTVSVPD